MPPRYVYWTILVDNGPTAFRAREREELLPTLNQLRRKNADVALKWYARGKLWESPEAERAAARVPKPIEKRGHDWRPGGQHQDPRARFDKRKKLARTTETDAGVKKPGGPPSGERPWSKKPGGSDRVARNTRRADGPTSTRTSGPAGRKRWPGPPRRD